MAIDTAAKRRNVSRMMNSLFMGLAPSAGLDTDDRVNAARAYIGFVYTAPVVGIDTAAKRRNVSRMMNSLFMGLAPSAGLDTDDRVNAARAYIGFDYAAPVVGPDRYIFLKATNRKSVVLKIS